MTGENKTIVRVKTSHWWDQKGVYVKKSLTFLKRKCSGFNVIKEDCSNVDAEDALTRVINLDSVKDGVYEVITVNESRDWETGYVDEWEYKLMPL